MHWTTSFFIIFGVACLLEAFGIAGLLVTYRRRPVSEGSIWRTRQAYYFWPQMLFGVVLGVIWVIWHH